MALLTKQYTLSLNKAWQPIDVKSVGDAIIKMTADTAKPAYAVNVTYQEDIDEDGNIIALYDQILGMEPVDWDTWCKLPVRPYHKAIKTSEGYIRAPLVIINRNYNDMPLVRLTLNKKGIYQRDKGIDQYTGKPLALEEATIDHVIPKKRGGGNTWDNVVITNKYTNNKKGHKLNEEAGLTLVNKRLRKPAPIPRSKTIVNVNDIPEWKVFIK